MKRDEKNPGKVSRNLKYMHVLMIWDELTDIVGGDKSIGAALTAAFFCSQLAGSTPNPFGKRERRARARHTAIKSMRRGNPRDHSKPKRQ